MIIDPVTLKCIPRSGSAGDSTDSTKSGGLPVVDEKTPYWYVTNPFLKYLDIEDIPGLGRYTKSFDHGSRRNHMYPAKQSFGPTGSKNSDRRRG
jgi:hypothetical protein